jgi:transcriptional regulator with XRE-family HTH domain
VFMLEPKKNLENKVVPHHVDVHVGMRLKNRRKALQLSQKKLGELVNISFQQVQKYESGMNRIVASKLYEFGVALDMHAADFFHGLHDNKNNKPHQLHDDKEGYESESILDSYSLELMRLFQNINDVEVKKHIIEVVRSISTKAKIDD